MSDRYDRFESWIEGMSESEYNDWLENKASSKQIERALSFREMPDDDQMQQLEQQQIYDNRQIQRISEVDIPKEQDVTIVDKSVTPDKETVVISPEQQQPTIVLPEKTKPKQKRSLIDRLKGLFRRKKK